MSDAFTSFTNYLGTPGTVIVTIMALIGLYIVVKLLPDFFRYMRLRQM